jgi:hypothetical protein
MDEKAPPMVENNPQGEGSADGSEKGSEKPAQPSLKPSADLPQDVRTKLRKLEMLESKYKGN